MKKLYRKGVVHPTASAVSDHLLSFLPAAILALTVALSPEDKEVLAYLMTSCSSASTDRHKVSGSKGREEHSPSFNCCCFHCYTSYWAKWDSSPNRQLIHEIIDAFEDGLSKKEKNRKGKRKGKSGKGNLSLKLDEAKKSDTRSIEGFSFKESYAAADGGQAAGGGMEEEEDKLGEESGKGSVRRFMNFVGERIWSVWG